MHKFNLLRNEDGSISYFRATCLIIVALCMVLYAFLDHTSAGTQDGAAATEGEKTSALNAVFENKAEQEAKLRLQRRQEALAELDDGRHFLTTCGNINAGFEGCRFEFSPQILQFYDAAVEAADDGFSLMLTAKGDQAADLCVTLGADSQGPVYALDKQGKRREECVPQEMRTADLSALHRRIDEIVPQVAPSGRSPIVTRTAQREGNTTDFQSLNTDNRKI